MLDLGYYAMLNPGFREEKGRDQRIYPVLKRKPLPCRVQNQPFSKMMTELQQRFARRHRKRCRANQKVGHHQPQG